MTRLLLLVAALAMPQIATAQTVTIASPNTVNPNGQPRAVADVFVRNADGSIMGGKASCSTVSGTLSAAGQSVTLACADSGAFAITVTPSGFAGTLSFASTAGSPKRVIRNGQVPLQISTVPFTSADTGVRYYSVNGGNGLTVTAPTLTSGSVTVSISATGQAIYPIPIGEFQAPSLVSLLNGRSFTSGYPGGEINVPNGQFACMSVSNSAGSGVRGIWEQRSVSTDVLPSQRPPRFYVINNPTSGNVTTAATISPRGAAGTASGMTVTYGVVAALPVAATSNGGRIPTGGIPMYILPEKTVEPGSTQVLCAQGVNATNTLGDTSNVSMPLAWREQNIN